MMKIQRLIKKFGLDAVLQKYAIDLTLSECGRLAIFNYGIKSPKRSSVVRECRSLVLEMGTWRAIGRPFPRFLNLGEDLAYQRKFNFDEFSVIEKVDGSFIEVFKYDGKIYVNTRSTFGNLNVDGFGGTWRELFLSTGVDLAKLYHNNDVTSDWTYCFELVSPYTTVVKTHSKTEAYLLAAIHNESGRELNRGGLKIVAGNIGAKMPKVYDIGNLQDAQDFLLKLEPEDEGFVFYDGDLRLKSKNPEYLIRHKLKSNGRVFLKKNLVEYMFSKRADLDELVSYFHDLQKVVEEIENDIANVKEICYNLWENNRHFDRKNFALCVKDTPYASILFECYKTLSFNWNSTVVEKFFLRRYENVP